jgi:hypothetical protein
MKGADSNIYVPFATCHNRYYFAIRSPSHGQCHVLEIFPNAGTDREGEKEGTAAYCEDERGGDIRQENTILSTISGITTGLANKKLRDSGSELVNEPLLPRDEPKYPFPKICLVKAAR